MTNMQSSRPWWKTPKGIAVLIALAVLGLYLIIVHQQHVLGALPFLIILSCPLMHLFMHKGHGHHSETTDDKNQTNKPTHKHDD